MKTQYQDYKMMQENQMMQDNQKMAYQEMLQDDKNMAYPMDNVNIMGSGYPADGHYLNERLVKTIQDCEATCEHMTNHLKKLSDFNIRVRQSMLLRDCADICGLTAKFVARGAIFSRQAAFVCSNICEECGLECARFPDQMSQSCARICLHCARECRRYANSQ